MLLLARLFHIHSIRHSSSTRDFFANLKKLYRSTTSDLFMASNHRTCFVFDKDESTKILIQMVYEIPSTKTRRKFNLLRSVDESLSQTIRRLTANIEQAAKKTNKRREKKQINGASHAEQSVIIIQLLDSNNQPIDESQTNKYAWLNCRKLLINEQSYDVEYNAPGRILFLFSKSIYILF
jgi:hypothetical protein